MKWQSLFAFQNKDAATRTGTDEAARRQPHSTSRHRAPEKEESGLPGTGIGTRGTTWMQGLGLEGLGRQPPARAFAPFTCCLTALRIRFTFDALYSNQPLCGYHLSHPFAGGGFISVAYTVRFRLTLETMWGIQSAEWPSLRWLSSLSVDVRWAQIRHEGKLWPGSVCPHFVNFLFCLLSYLYI